jgi:alkaline phosphatase
MRPHNLRANRDYNPSRFAHKKNQIVMENDPLLPGGRAKRTCTPLILQRSLATFFIFLSVCVICLAAMPTDPTPKSTRPRNVILLISDGFGPASQTLARNYFSEINSLPPSTILPLDSILVGSSRSRSASSLITDSAAGATAFSCGLKTTNRAIGVNVDGKRCATVLEAAKKAGYRTGLVATNRITDATPAVFNCMN